MHKDAASIKYFSNIKLGSNNQSKIYPHGLNISKFKTSNSKLNNNIIKSSTNSSPCPIKSFNNFYQNKTNILLLYPSMRTKKRIFSTISWKK